MFDSVIAFIKEYIYLVPAFIALLGTVILFIFVRLAGQRTQASLRGREILRYKMYFTLQRIPLASAYVKRMSRRLRNVSVYTKREVYAKAVSYFLIQLLAVSGAAVYGFVFFTDPVSIAFSVIIAFMVVEVRIRKSLFNMHYIVLKQLAVAEEDLRLQYSRVKDVVLAVESITVGKRLVNAFSELTKVLTEDDSEYKLQCFIEDVPFQPLQTLAQVCCRIEQKDTNKTKDGEDPFENALLSMKNDVLQEMEKLKYQHIIFGNSEFLCLTGVAAMPVAQWFLHWKMPGTDVLLQGMYGYILRFVVLLVSAYSFWHVANVCSLEPFKLDDRIGFIKKLSENSIIRSLIRPFEPVNTTKKASRRILKRKLKAAASKKSVTEFVLEKALWVLGLFMALTLTYISALVLGRAYIEKSTSSLQLIEVSDLSAYRQEDILALDNEYISLRNGGYEFYMDDPESVKELETIISSHLPGLSGLQTEDQMKRLQKKYDFLQSLRFSWLFLPVALLLSALGVLFPEHSLKSRKELFRQAEESEFMQIQTFTMVLVGIGCDTLDALEYLASLSVIHKEDFIYAFHAYGQNPYGVIDEIIEKTPVEGFVQYLKKLKLTVDDLSFEDAFSDIVIDANHLRNERNQVIKNDVEKRRSSCSKYMTASLILVAAGFFVFPMLYIGFTDMLAQINEINKL